jgi:hypothetical protein
MPSNSKVLKVPPGSGALAPSRASHACLSMLFSSALSSGAISAAIKLLKHLMTFDLGSGSPADVLASRLLHVFNVNVTVTACCLFNIRH